MKKLVLTLIMLAAGMAASAQITHTPNGAVDKNAEQILTKAAQKFAGEGVSFTVTMINKNAEKRETARQKADVLYSRGRYRVSFGDNIIYCDGNATWHLNKEVNEVTVNKMSESEDDLMNPAAILSNYNKNFKVKFIRQEANGNAIIDLTPKKGKSYYKIRVIVNANTGVLQRMEMHNYDGSCGEYIVSNFKSGVKVSDADFIFPGNKYPNVEVIDMR